MFSTHPPLLQHCLGSMQTELGHGQPEASSSHHFTSSVKTSGPWMGFKHHTRTFRQYLSASAELLLTTGAVHLNDLFWTAPWISNTLFEVTAKSFKLLIWAQFVYVGQSWKKLLLGAVDAVLVMDSKSQKDYLSVLHSVMTKESCPG